MRFDIFRVQGDRPFLRLMLLFMVFGLTALAFWWHFERRMAQIAPPRGERFLRDEARIIPVEEARALQGWRKAFKDGLGLDVLVMVSPHKVVVPDFAPGTLFVGLGLGRAAESGKSDKPDNQDGAEADKPDNPDGAEADKTNTAEAVIALPPLARKALSEGQRLQWEEGLARCAAAPDAAPAACLQQTLKSLWQDLGGK